MKQRLAEFLRTQLILQQIYVDRHELSGHETLVATSARRRQASGAFGSETRCSAMSTTIANSGELAHGVSDALGIEALAAYR